MTVEDSTDHWVRRSAIRRIPSIDQRTMGRVLSSQFWGRGEGISLVVAHREQKEGEHHQGDVPVLPHRSLLLATFPCYSPAPGSGME